MKKLRSFALFWYGFIVGDDWRVALGVASGLGLSAIFVHILHLSAWWVLPLFVMATLALSLRLSIDHN